MNDIEDFLRDNKPQVKEDPTFILEAQRRMEQVDGIKAEVDRQRTRGRVALLPSWAASNTSWRSPNLCVARSKLRE